MRLLLTTFGPYEEWTSNASQMAVDRLDLERFDADVDVRQYPVDFAAARDFVLAHHRSGFDLIVHVGQSRRATKVELEMMAINFGRESDEAPYFPLESTGPPAFCSDVDYPSMLPLIGAEEIPVELSFHAGLFICNAVFYWSQMAAATAAPSPVVSFVHLPLDGSQRASDDPGGRLPIEKSARALEIVVGELIKNRQARE
jgi:pyroglutamyl-peptidase